MPADALPAWPALLASWDGWLLAVILVVVVPVYGWLRYRSVLKRPGIDAPSGVKLRMYATILVMQWVLVAIMLYVIGRHGLDLADVGQRLVRPRLVLGLAAGLVLACAILLVINRARIKKAPPEKIEPSVGRLRKFLPITRAELAVFVLLSLTAGICEELLYRGFLVGFLGAGLGSIWYGVLAGAVLFGLAHAYQGRKGVLLTGLAGLILGVLFAATGSLVPGQAGHAAFDIVGGFAGAAAVARLRASA